MQVRPNLELTTPTRTLISGHVTATGATVASPPTSHADGTPQTSMVASWEKCFWMAITATWRSSRLHRLRLEVNRHRGKAQDLTGRQRKKPGKKIVGCGLRGTSIPARGISPKRIRIDLNHANLIALVNYTKSYC